MAALFSTIIELQNVVGGSVNRSSFTIESILPFFDIAHERHIEDWLGTAIYEDLKTALDGSPTPAQTALLPYYRKPLAWLALYEYLGFAAAQIGDTGVHRIETDSRKTAYKYQEKRVIEACLANGYEALEKLLLFLEANKVTYTDWPNAPGYLRHHEVLLHSAATFRIAQSKKISRHVFDQVRAIIEDVENFAIVPAISQEQYDALLAARKTGTWTTEEKEKKVIYMLQRAAAHFTLDNAIRLNFVQFEGDSVVQREYLEDQSVPKMGKPTLSDTGLRLSLHDDNANRWLKKALDYLKDNIDDDAFEHYKTLYDAQVEAAAAAAAEEAACTTTCDTSERRDGGNAFGFGLPCEPKRKGIVTL